MTDNKDKCTTCIYHFYDESTDYCYNFKRNHYDKLQNTNGCDRHMTQHELEKRTMEEVNKEKSDD
jgi:hypothetical protein